ncbi:MAG TPA: glycoside hydrolase family 88 protein [Opitutaceae bacterium]|nr:glycoside hydrolase family 88 protein [Opitutaceae bacterium]
MNLLRFSKLPNCFLFFALSLASARAGVSATRDWLMPDQIKSAMRTVCDYTATHPGGTEVARKGESNGWVRAAFFVGVIEAYQATKDPSYLKLATDWAEANQWQTAKRTIKNPGDIRHGDDQCCGQTYLELNEISPSPEKIAAIRAKIDSIIADPKPGREDWWWCDALFMAPSVYAQLGRATGDNKYYEALDKMYWDSADFLYDDDGGLFYRDKRFFGKRTAHGQKVFWSRGNGWVIAGLARILTYLPKTDPAYPKYGKLFARMAAELVPLQGVDGLWRTSLLDAAEYPAPETSGSGFFCYALAWGIAEGRLPKATYEPVVQKAWKGLCGSIQSNGSLGWVQVVGYQPDVVKQESTQDYGSGAFLLAGSQMLRLVEAKPAKSE